MLKYPGGGGGYYIKETFRKASEQANLKKGRTEAQYN